MRESPTHLCGSHPDTLRIGDIPWNNCELAVCFSAKRCSSLAEAGFRQAAKMAQPSARRDDLSSSIGN